MARSFWRRENSVRKPARERQRDSHQEARRRFFRPHGEPLEPRHMLAGNPYLNAADPYDVVPDGVRSVRDVFVLKEELEKRGAGPLPKPNGPVQYYVDVNDDGSLTAEDIDRWLRNETGTLDDGGKKSGFKSGGSGGITTLSGPSVTLNPVTVNEGQSFAMSGSVSPPAMYMLQGGVDWGSSPGTGSESFTVYTDSSGNFTLPHVYFDDGPAPGNGTPSDVENITMTGTVMGQSGSSPANASTTATIQNVNPVPQLTLINYMPFGGPQWKVSGAISDAGIPDQQDITIDWGDGSTPTLIENWPTNTQFEQLHEYPSNDESGVPKTFPITVSVVDDDTGTAQWSDGAPMYLLDLDNDANNDNAISADDDPIEALPAGRYVLVNDDDDNQNSIPDGSESGPVSGENDLEPFLIKWAPANRPELNNYDGWNLVLTVSGAANKLWAGSDKSGPVALEQTPIGDGVHWVIGQDSIPSTLYLEALGGGEIQINLLLANPQWGPVDGDTVVFTAIATQGTGVAIAGIKAEEHYWGDNDSTWFKAKDPLWSHDEHRWSTTVLPASAAPQVNLISWIAEAYVGQTEPTGENSHVFAQAFSASPAKGSPGVGDWFIYPIAIIGIMPVQAKGERWTQHRVTGVYWEGVDPGDGATNFIPSFFDSPAEIFPERNHPIGSKNANGEPIDQIHDKVNVVVEIENAVPEGKTATLQLRVYDPDNPLPGGADPNDGDPLTTKADDNVKGGGGHAIGVTPFSFALTFQENESSATKQVTISEPQPGNNFIVAAHSQKSIADGLKFRDDGVSLYYRNPRSFVETDVPETHRSATLEVWRTLWVESDHMDAPKDTDGPFDGDPKCADFEEGCDDPMFTPSDPTISALTELLAPARVSVKPLPAEYDKSDADPKNIPFKHYQTNTTTPGRDVSSSRFYWEVHMLGAYEWQIDRDNDPNRERWIAGWSEHEQGEDPTNFVFEETARDLWAEPELPRMVPFPVGLDRISAHEALHRFFGWHADPSKGQTPGIADEGIMDATTLMTAASITLTDGQIKKVQETAYPK